MERRSLIVWDSVQIVIHGSAGKMEGHSIQGDLFTALRALEIGLARPGIIKDPLSLLSAFSSLDGLDNGDDGGGHRSAASGDRRDKSRIGDIEQRNHNFFLSASREAFMRSSK